MGGTRLIITGPVSVILGSIAVVAAVIDTHFEHLLLGAGLLLVGLSIMLFPGLRYWGKAKPWDQPGSC
jgi:uncharacterized membrane protein HdeD (DUF308 family)